MLDVPVPVLDLQLPVSDLQVHVLNLQLHVSALQLHVSALQLHASALRLHVLDLHLHALDLRLHVLDLHLQPIFIEDFGKCMKFRREAEGTDFIPLGNAVFGVRRLDGALLFVLEGLPLAKRKAASSRRTPKFRLSAASIRSYLPMASPAAWQSHRSDESSH